MLLRQEPSQPVAQQLSEMLPGTWQQRLLHQQIPKPGNSNICHGMQNYESSTLSLVWSRESRLPAVQFQGMAIHATGSAFEQH